MKKLKIYLDTSVISYLQAEDVPEKMAITNNMWNQIITGRYKACISDMVLQELSNCYEDKRQRLLEKIADIDFEIYEIDDNVNELAQKYIQAGAFVDKNLEDALHVACASVNTCNAVVSWNFKHIVKLSATLLVNGVNRLEGYMGLEIVSPEFIVEEE
jgi:predicted nucleic acid-binding protein